MSRGAARGSRWLCGGVILLGLALAAAWVSLNGETHPEWRLLGRVHPVLVHFPIVLLLLVPLAEWLGRRRAAWRDVAGGLLTLSLFGSLVAVAAGFALAYADGQSGPLVTAHWRGGVVLAVIATLAWMVRGGRWPAVYWILLLGGVGLLGWTAHQGGSLTHGEYYLTEGVPPAWRKRLRLPEPPAPEIYPADTLMGAAIRPTLDRYCLSCHGPAKQKGNYRMDSFAQLLAGGASGRTAIVPGQAEQSELLRRVHLPRTDRKAMPPEGQLRPSEAEIQLLEWWIAQGAVRELTLADAVGRDPAFAELWRAVQPPGASIDLPKVGDYTALQPEIVRLEREHGIRLIPVSKRPGDGLILRTRGREKSFDGAALAAVAPLAPYVVEAELAGTPLAEADLVALKEFRALTRLDLSRTRLTGEGFATLTGLARLESINLSEARLTDAGLDRLTALKSLRRLYITGTAVSPEALARFRERMPECEIP